MSNLTTLNNLNGRRLYSNTHNTARTGCENGTPYTVNIFFYFAGAWAETPAQKSRSLLRSNRNRKRQANIMQRFDL